MARLLRCCRGRVVWQEVRHDDQGRTDRIGEINARPIPYGIVVLAKWRRNAGDGRTPIAGRRLVRWAQRGANQASASVMTAAGGSSENLGRSPASMTSWICASMSSRSRSACGCTPKSENTASSVHLPSKRKSDLGKADGWAPAWGQPLRFGYDGRESTPVHWGAHETDLVLAQGATLEPTPVRKHIRSVRTEHGWSEPAGCLAGSTENRVTRLPRFESALATAAAVLNCPNAANSVRKIEASGASGASEE
jgi:hypothetical protein